MMMTMMMMSNATTTPTAPLVVYKSLGSAAQLSLLLTTDNRLARSVGLDRIDLKVYIADLFALVVGNNATSAAAFDNATMDAMSMSTASVQFVLSTPLLDFIRRMQTLAQLATPLGFLLANPDAVLGDDRRRLGGRREQSARRRRHARRS